MSKSNSLNSIDSHPFFQWYFNLIDNSFRCDPSLSQLLGYSTTENMTIKQFFKAFEANDVKKIKQLFKEVVKTRNNITESFVMITSTERHLVELSIYYIENKKGLIEGGISFSQQLPSTMQENELLQLLFNNMNSGMMIADSDHTIIMVNEEYCLETGYQDRELLGQKASILKSGRYDPTFYQKLWKIVDKDKKWKGELLAKNSMGRIYAHEVQLSRIDLPTGSHYYSALTQKVDVSTALFDDKPEGDSYTHSIPSKQAYSEKLKQHYQKISPGKTIVSAAFNVKLLQKTTQQTVNWLTSQRFALKRENGHLGFITDTMFGAFWVIDRNVESIDLLLRTILNNLSGNDLDNEVKLMTIVTMGVSVLGVDANSPAQLMTHCVQTLIANTNSQTSNLYYFDRRLSKRFDRRETLAALLKEALKEKEVDVYYQPIMEIPSLRIKKFEALFRIKLETTIDYDTQELISIAEYYNWIDLIDRLVTQKALKALPLIQQHYGLDDIGMSINRSLANDKLARCCLEETFEILTKSGANLSQVTIELTESAFFGNLEQQQLWLDRLKEQGVKLSIDDFGTGYSSFSYLKDLPVDFIKIDRSFVTNLKFDSHEYSMIEMLCTLTHKMGGLIIAEGVETEEELMLLSRAKVDLLQGYIFSKPLSLEDILSVKNSFLDKRLVDVLYKEPILTVEAVMQRDYQCIDLDDRLGLAREKFQNGHFLLAIKSKQCLGILTQSLLHAALSPYLDTEGEQHRDRLTLDKRVHQVMDRNFLCVHSNKPVDELYVEFSKDPNQIVVVIDENEKCIGTVTSLNLLERRKSGFHN